MTAARFYSSTAGVMALQGNITDTSTSCSVDTTVGLPGTTPFTVVIDPGTTEEIVTVTGVAGTTLTIVRGQDGSPAQAHTAGATIRHMATARDFREPQEHIGNTVAHGVAGNVVGTTDTQTLTNKNLTSGTNSFPSSLATTSALTTHTSATTAHGVSGTLVGTSDNQTLTNKDFSDPSNVFPTSLATDTELASHANTTALVHGVAGTLVGTTDTQALSNKDMTASTNTFPPSLALSSDLATLTGRVTTLENQTADRSKVGTGSFVFNGSGEATLTHNLGVVPTYVSAVAHITAAGAPIIIAPKFGTSTTTAVTLCAFSIAANAIYTGTITTVGWLVAA